MRIRRLPSRPALGVALLASLLVLLDLGRRILATNDEARFALLAQDMLDRGAWFFPRLNDVGYHTKPLLQAWLIALCSWPVGHVTQLTAVLPSALAGIGTVLVVHAVGRSMFGVAVGRAAALVALTTQGWFLHARLPMPDMLLTLFITASLAMFWRVVAGRPGRNWLAFYGLTALAFWAKGAAGLMPLAVALVYAIVTRRRARWHDLHLPVGLALVALLIAPWWIAQWLSDVAATRAVVMEDYAGWYVPRALTLTRFTEPVQHVVGILFPWVLLAPVAIWQAVRFPRERGAERHALEILLVWSAVVFGCVAVSKQQRLRYYLPLISPAALLIGWWAARVMAEGRAIAQIPWRVYGIAAAGVAVATAAAFHLRPTWARGGDLAMPKSAIEVAVMAGGLLLMVGAALGHGSTRNATGRAFLAAWLGSALWVGGWYHWELERRNAAYDYPRVHAETARLLPEAPVVAAWGVYELPFSFYFDRKVVSVSSGDALRRVMAQHPRASAVVTTDALAEIEDTGRLRVLPLERLNFRPIVLVTYSAPTTRP